MPLCTKVVVATGFSRLTLPVISISGMDLIDNKIFYNDETMSL